MRTQLVGTRPERRRTTTAAAQVERRVARTQIALLPGFVPFARHSLPRELPREELDANALVWDIHRRLRGDLLPIQPIVARLEIARAGDRFLLLRRGEVSLCTHKPGLPRGAAHPRLAADADHVMAQRHRFEKARRAGMTVDGKRAWVRAFPTWCERYLFARGAPA